MKALALGLLLLAALVYMAAVVLGPRHGAWGYVAAAAEAAMIGALADWFAVVALFRHPLGLPIPHTAIIAAHKDRLGAALARFLGDHFLTKEQVGEALQRWDVADHLGRWLADRTSAQRLSDWILQAAPSVLAGLDHAPLRSAAARLGQRLLGQANLAELSGQTLTALTEHGHHQQWLNGVLNQIAEWAEQDNVQAGLTEAIARELKELKYLRLDQVAARLATHKLVTALSRTLSEVAEDPDHELRQRFDQWMVDTLARLQSDPEWQAKVAGWRDEWLVQPGMDAQIESWVGELLDKLLSLAQAPSANLRDRVASTVQSLGERVLAEPALRQAIQAQAQPLLLDLLERNRPLLLEFVTTRVQAWDAAEMSGILEQHIGRDLQFIRINGTLVGALVGLVLHALTQVALAWPWLQAAMGS
ncbi:DUF445 domain-containing protein [Hydrogenophaga sp. PAMC20947]|uniref:DUF445 domain-containing protein n=1 Tax=Hydrogenophaga sp. PAMC20947 TaxID=2565558 RepID=UPI00109E2510|nr:DUF445 domain-containing protein [Hydrogenophaga sp. PAMC20947]QCB45768.1 DUF445 domain-containing protein [Hydrogenophaga sp. PAMC20947]